MVDKLGAQNVRQELVRSRKEGFIWFFQVLGGVLLVGIVLGLLVGYLIGSGWRNRQ